MRYRTLFQFWFDVAPHCNVISTKRQRWNNVEMLAGMLLENFEETLVPYDPLKIPVLKNPSRRLLLFYLNADFSFPSYFSKPPTLQPDFSDPWRSSPDLSSTLVSFGCLLFPGNSLSYTATATGLRHLPQILVHFWLKIQCW